MKQACVYILASRTNGTLYTGVTAEPIQRSPQHHIHRLVWYEVYESMEEAIEREKVLKKWNRAWKLRLISEMNPEWRNLYETPL